MSWEDDFEVVEQKEEDWDLDGVDESAIAEKLCIPSDDKLFDIQPKSKSEFANFGIELAKTLSANCEDPGFQATVEALLLEGCSSLTPVEIRQLSSSLTILLNARIKQSKVKPAKGKRASKI